MKRILIVQDEPRKLKNIPASLRARGYDVAVKTNAADARDAIESTPFDAMLLDVVFPETEGGAIHYNPKTGKVDIAVSIGIANLFRQHNSESPIVLDSNYGAEKAGEYTTTNLHYTTAKKHYREDERLTFILEAIGTSNAAPDEHQHEAKVHGKVAYFRQGHSAGLPRGDSESPEYWAERTGKQHSGPAPSF